MGKSTIVCGRLPADSQVLSGIAFCHARGVVHRDLTLGSWKLTGPPGDGFHPSRHPEDLRKANKKQRDLIQAIKHVDRCRSILEPGIHWNDGRTWDSSCLVL